VTCDVRFSVSIRHSLSRRQFYYSFVHRTAVDCRMQESMLGRAATAECYSDNRHRERQSSVGCMSWLSHLLPRRHHGKLTL